MYRGSPIFYSLGNFAIEQPHVWDPRITETDSFKHLQSLNPSWSLDRAYTAGHTLERDRTAGAGRPRHPRGVSACLDPR
jgi:hypothetical protein